MITRLRYKKDGNTLSTDSLLLNNTVVYGTIDVIAGVVVVFVDDKPYFSNEFTNLNKAKKAIKDTMISLGVSFNGEVRAKKERLNKRVDTATSAVIE